MLFMIFTIDKITRSTALTILAGYLFYYLFVAGLSGVYFYAGLATLELLVGGFIIIMQIKLKTIKAVGYICITAIVCNFIAWVLYENNFSNTIHTNMGFCIMISQALAMMWTLLKDAMLLSIYNDHGVFYIADDSRQSCNKTS